MEGDKNPTEQPKESPKLTPPPPPPPPPRQVKGGDKPISPKFPPGTQKR